MHAEKETLVFIHHLGLGKDFLNVTPKTQAIKEEMDKLDTNKIQSFVLQ